ncbi:MAG: ATP-dependent RNA helicase [Zetaproteobacteria bacterium CG12_big_fil_rev_8_21_14_0_65_54_13]|nr:MAG: ATP-dependent RNA helicase [Zetaproteobacteria bacterium CG12_big_fil_rev_8_21_14_0_65_54_13]PIX54964.1 MAG: ATP-dependent RNA helicase [Zetaproteobacteria bacterium CG_4_10_14_3_um_filter_54_28]PJA27649.1 MAG: ATP-dependent RNA helicase [Zetaproteobacteria bacterium CG_4_9_14_3_um_filter_54_145]
MPGFWHAPANSSILKERIQIIIGSIVIIGLLILMDDFSSL